MIKNDISRLDLFERRLIAMIWPINLTLPKNQGKRYITFGMYDVTCLPIELVFLFLSVIICMQKIPERESYDFLIINCILYISMVLKISNCLKIFRRECTQENWVHAYYIDETRFFTKYLVRNTITVPISIVFHLIFSWSELGAIEERKVPEIPAQRDAILETNKLEFDVKKHLFVHAFS